MFAIYIMVGIWIITSGVIGVMLAKQPTSNCLHGCNMAFNIVCAVGSFIMAISYYLIYS